MGVFVIAFVAALDGLRETWDCTSNHYWQAPAWRVSRLGLETQTLVHDFINGFYILLENQYDIGDTIRVAGVKGIVEEMTLRHTVYATTTEQYTRFRIARF